MAKKVCLVLKKRLTDVPGEDAAGLVFGTNQNQTCGGKP